MLALGLHTHAVIVAAIIHPLRHVATAGRVVCLGGECEGRSSSAASCLSVEGQVLGREGSPCGGHSGAPTSGKLQLKQEAQPHLEQVVPLPRPWRHRMRSQP